MDSENNGTEIIREPILDTQEMRKMFVGGIPPDATDEEMKTFFEEKCDVTLLEFNIIKKESSKDVKSRFGFALFETAEQLDIVLLNRKELNFKGRQLDVNRAIPKDNQTAGIYEKTKKLFVANLPKLNCTEEDLKNYFDQRHDPKFGTIESVQLIKKKDDQGNKLEENKGYGFVIVSSEDMADKMAIQHANFEFGGRKIELKKSVPNSESGRGGGRGRGGQGGGYNASPYGGGYWNDPYAYAYGGYDMYGYAPAYGGGYGPPPQRGRGGPRGGGRFTPY